MVQTLNSFAFDWILTALSLWIASHVFRGIRFGSSGAVIIAALLLGFANALVRPVLILLTLPLTLVTLGFFLLVINALMILLVAKLVKGFKVTGFWTAFFASIFVSLLSMVLASILGDTFGTPPPPMLPSGGGTWL
ncbi:MAG: phage holin family protein [Rhodocyclaceae bacterium]|nr:phage holin family protein [Rhodocyclaceae bacterium]